jgi:hypothetical protein
MKFTATMKAYSRTGIKFYENTILRETKLFYIDTDGNKYKKKNGKAPETKRGPVHNCAIELCTLKPRK